ncbi:DUF2927 domain-containing protein [Sulfitobacter sp. PS-8MA]|uniref:DUF2927 domain-containing protein n=1 Tax=Sulfitobacter sp. PS-8MA TaxID=3237707 RepID=UPI0034C61D74
MRRSAKARLVLPMIMLLNACVPASHSEVASRAVIADSTLPPMKQFSSAPPAPPQLSNTVLAQDFLDLAFRMESGRTLPVLTRFEGPITLRVAGKAPATLAPDLARLLARLRHEAGIELRQVTGERANITIQAISRNQIQKLLPQAACFVVPNVSTLAEYRRTRRAPSTDWTRLTERRKLAIFLPNDVSPQETRDCLHEELAQALGPLNDLYRLPDSVFNDDNVHTVLTGFDMLILRAYYDPALRSGMTREEAAAALPEVLARLNPAGGAVRMHPAPATPQVWGRAIQTALGRDVSRSTRLAAAQDALRIAQTQGWQDNRRAFSHYAMGRVIQMTDPVAAQSHYTAADSYYGLSPNTALHRTYVATQRAGYAVTRGDGAAALAVIEPHLASAEAGENAALLATLLLLKAEALQIEGRDHAARRVRLDSIGWARYGFGPDWAVRAKLREIASLNPHRGSASNLGG